jgi:cephalosporin hydroxylase
MERDEIVRRFAKLCWAEGKTTFFANRFMGVPTLQHPFDAWVTQEIICEVRSDLVIECGSYRGGSAVDPSTLEQVRARAAAKRTLVILDSDHSKRHVIAELDAYAPLVSPGSYLIVQDGVVNGHPVEPDYGPGPYEAIEEFLQRDDRFEVDVDRQRMLFTFNPKGFLRRRGDPT